MTQLHQLLAARVKDWREAGYPSEPYPALGEILEYQADADTGADTILTDRLDDVRRFAAGQDDAAEAG